MAKMNEILFAMEMDADDPTVKSYVAGFPADAAEVLRQLLAEAQKKIEDLEEQAEQLREEVENYRQGLGEDSSQ